MARPLKTLDKYGALVIADVELEAVRVAGCLCLRCIRMVTVDDCLPLVTDPGDQLRVAHADQMARAFNCPTAQRIYEACQDGDVAAPISRCPMFIEKNKE